MKYVLGMIAILVLAGCSNNPSSKSLLETIEFGEDETGCARIQGSLDVSTGMFVSSTVAVTIIKKKGEDVPNC